MPDMAYYATDMADNNENVIGYAYMKCSRQVVRIKQLVRRYCSEFVLENARLTKRIS